FQGHCFYHGYAVEIPKSAVSLSTCFGLRGLLQLDNVSYGIEPLPSAAIYEHVIYQIWNDKINFSLLKENYPMTQLEDQPYRILVKSKENSDVVLLKRNLKIQVIMDKALYDYMGSEVPSAVEKVVHIFGLINTIFSQFKMAITLSYLELWSDKNKISTNGDPDDVLQRFLAWKQAYLVQRPNDMAFLLIYRDHPNYMGATYQGMACSAQFAAGIALYPKRITLETFSAVVTQLIGINLGLTYDDIYKCYCPGNMCIMNPEAIHSSGVKFFSSCSLDEFKRIVSQPEFECLQNKTVSKVAFQGRLSKPACGNGILEIPEQCDCGSPEDCKYKKCCNPVDCTLIGFAECGTGTCCDAKTCVIAERGQICRKSRDPCDFTEYCNGTSEFCVPDVVSADLEPCLNFTAFCYGGICRTMERQCVELFGKFAKSADYLCTQEVNFQTDDFGNCKSRRCSFAAILCGKVVCHWTKSELVQVPGYDIQYTYMGGHVCLSAFLRNATLRKLHDNTFVEDGTICGSNKFCKSLNCLSVHGYEKRPNCNSLTKCNGHGVCNQNLNCQCDIGYAPPRCESSPSSIGGSIDDGFWVAQEDEVNYLSDQNQPLFVRQRAAHQQYSLWTSFYIFLPFLILTSIIALKWNKVKQLWNRTGAVSGGPTSEKDQTVE
ncbi:A disintegrin and metallopeptidase domain 3-like, partial [Orycteropus afer afer]|uniref:A disintegrin and metallopeptidase domain 3-like n=1 Tax=Orycteropus afer afer TaxID=1230840 RepID=A0A8B6ZC71_ORYAF